MSENKKGRKKTGYSPIEQIATVILFVGASLACSKEKDDVTYKGGIDSHNRK